MIVFGKFHADKKSQKGLGTPIVAQFVGSSPGMEMRRRTLNGQCRHFRLPTGIPDAKLCTFHISPGPKNWHFSIEAAMFGQT